MYLQPPTINNPINTCWARPQLPVLPLLFASPLNPLMKSNVGALLMSTYRGQPLIQPIYYINHTMKHTPSREFLRRNTPDPMKDRYQKLCQDKKIRVNPGIKAALAKNEVAVDLSRIGSEMQQDWQGIQALLRQNTSMGIIVKNSKAKGKVPSRPEEHKHQTQLRQKALVGVFSSVGANLSTNGQLIYLKVEQCQLSAKSLSCLGKGLAESASIRELHLRECQLTTDDLRVLTPGLCRNQSLYLADLGNNHLDDLSGCLIRQVMGTHLARRDESVYTSSLRGESAQKVSLGLLEYDLSANRLSHRFVETIQSVMRHDRWLKSVDLSNNLIDAHGVSVLLDTLYESSSLISLDLRHNPGFCTEVSNQVLEYLLRNISALQEKSVIWHSFQKNSQPEQKYLICKIGDQSMESQYGINNLRLILFENKLQQEEKQACSFYNQKVQASLSKGKRKKENLDSKIQKQYEQLNIIHENLKMKQVLQKIQLQLSDSSPQDIRAFINNHLGHSPDLHHPVDFAQQDHLMSQIELQMSELSQKMLPPR